jgi:chorismate mutase/prephenate dehydratase
MELSELRENIDRIDRQVVKLINERYGYVKKVGEWKQNRDHEIYVPEREKALLEKLEKINDGPMTNETLRAIYREIMSGALALEHPLSVAFLGPETSFSHLGALNKFGHSVNYVARNSIADVFNDVETGRIDYGCVPIENSTEGAVNHTLDMFINSSVQICAETNMRIHHNLMAKCELKDIKRIYSHVQILGQCRNWLLETFPNVELIEIASSTKAAELVCVEENSAAIASTLAAEIYGLNILAENIEDNAYNTTRFLIIGRQKPKPTNDDKTSICFAIRDRVGALYDCLLPFKNAGITMTMIESRPSKRKNWEYYFFIDILGHNTDENIQNALGELEKMAQSLRILGSYPKANQIV